MTPSGNGDALEKSIIPAEPRGFGKETNPVISKLNPRVSSSFGLSEVRSWLGCVKQGLVRE